MRRMKSDTLLDYAVFQLSPKRSRCELFAFSNGESDKLASGFVMPFVAHLRAAEEQIALSDQAIKLEVEGCRDSETWFTKGTLERFVRFVSTPEILELVNILDLEMSQLEATRKLYSQFQGAGDQLPGMGGSASYGVRVSSDKTMKELIRVIDVRLSAVKLDLETALSRAASAGFDAVTVSELQMFADQFSAHRLNEACHKFLSLCERRANPTNSWKDGTDEGDIRYSSESDMSIDADTSTRTNLYARPNQQRGSRSVNGYHSEETGVSSIIEKAKNSSMSSQVRRIRGSRLEKEGMSKNDKPATSKEIRERRLSDRFDSVASSPPVRRISIQDRIKVFESKKAPSGRVGKPVTEESPKIRRQANQEKTVLRKWRSTSDMSRDSIGKKTDTANSIQTDKSEGKKRLISSGSASPGKPLRKPVPRRALDRDLADQVQRQSAVRTTRSGQEISDLKPPTHSTSDLTDAFVGRQLVRSSSTVEGDARRNQNQWDPKGKLDLNCEDHVKDHFQSAGNSASNMSFESVVSDPERVERFISYSSESDGDSALKKNFERAVSDPEQVKLFIGSTGNFEHNDKLRMKADELEKLFAEHKLRVPGEPGSTRRNTLAGFSNNNRLTESSSTECSSMENTSCDPFTESDGNHSDASSDNLSDFSREKYYNTYLQRRNKKLIDEWSSRREEKEAKLKAMQDSFERSTEEIKRHNSLSTTRQIAEKFGALRSSSYNGRNM